VQRLTIKNILVYFWEFFNSKRKTLELVTKYNECSAGSHDTRAITFEGKMLQQILAFMHN